MYINAPNAPPPPVLCAPLSKHSVLGSCILENSAKDVVACPRIYMFLECIMLKLQLVKLRPIAASLLWCSLD